MTTSEQFPNSQRFELDERDVDPDPFVQFRRWLDAALAAQQPEPHAMTLATATRAGKPSARMVILRGLDERGFVFYTDYDSRKGEELAANPFASLVFYWAALSRQVRVEGRVSEVSAQEADAYFASRPTGSRLAAWAAPQSQVIASREALDQRMGELKQRYGLQPAPRPPRWGGYRIAPDVVEFWQGRASRLHDRLRYTRQTDGSWLIERLTP
jgi:pyridoxamine 5'-phosphate oxidase